MRGAVLATLLCAAIVVLPLQAQVTAALEGGGSRIDYAGSPDLSALSLSPSLEWLTPSTRFTAYGGFAQFSGGGWSLEGSTTMSGFTPPLGRFRGELAGAAVGSTSDGGVDAGEVLARGRLHLLGSSTGAWLGGALGRGWNGLAWKSDRRGDVGAWLRRGEITVLATAGPAWIGDSLRLVDADLTVRLAHRAIELFASGGARWWSRPAGAAGSTWGSLDAAVWLSPHLALIAAGGSYPADYAQELPAGRYLSLGMRLASRRPSREEERANDEALTRAGRSSAGGPLLRLPVPVVPSFEVRLDGQNKQVLRLRAPGAHSVDLIADFTGWQPLALERAPDGAWQVVVALAPGLYRINVRVDGGAWGVPPGVPSLTADFGGAVGILQVARP